MNSAIGSGKGGEEMLQALQRRRELASAGNRIKRGEAPKIETFASEVTHKGSGEERRDIVKSESGGKREVHEEATEGEGWGRK